MKRTTRPFRQPYIVDLSRPDLQDFPIVEFHLRRHKFAHDAKPTGVDTEKNPIFGTDVYEHGSLSARMSFGLPTLRLKRGSRPKIKFVNRTGYALPLHFHGLNTTGDVDGATEEVMFGLNTSIGPELVIHFPPIQNNSALLWYHAHPMFLTNDFMYLGVNGLVDIIDEISAPIADYFQDLQNRLFLVFQDLDLQSDGTATRTNIFTDENRACFGTVNGISCVNWYTGIRNQDVVPYVDTFQHILKNRRRLVKIDILNATSSFRFIHLGLVNEKGQILPFYLIQNDTGLMNPTRLTMVQIPHACRVAILFEMSSKSTNQSVRVMFYNYDLSEVGNVSPISGSQNDLQAEVPDSEQSSNPTVFPNPIPGPDSTLSYPVVPSIPTVNQILRNGNIIPPQESKRPFTAKPFLCLKRASKHKGKQPRRKELQKVITLIRRVVFGKKYQPLRQLLDTPGFEYDGWVNYLSLLNPSYFYNLPQLNSTSIRNILLFGDDTENTDVPGGNPLGSTEAINGANRIMLDMWNSTELELEQALGCYYAQPNEYQPCLLPTCLFKILPTPKDPLKNFNLVMIANDTLTIQLFDQPITYQDEKKQPPLASVTVVFPPTCPTKPLNIAKWVNLVNATFRSTLLYQGRRISDFATFDWTFYPFQFASVFPDKSWIIKTVMMKSTNKSSYWLKFVGHWPVLQMFGKSLNADTIPERTTIPDNQTSQQMIPKNMQIQQIFPMYATQDPDAPLPLMTDTDNAAIIIPPATTFKGFIDGFMNNAIIDFSVSLASSEVWVYHNGDTQDSHSLHFHATSAYVNVHSPLNTPGLVSEKRDYAAQLYSKDSYGIGPQQSLVFNITFVNYTSDQSVFRPRVRGLGYLIHCHFNHESMNGMMGIYDILKEEDRATLFERPQVEDKPKQQDQRKPKAAKAPPKPKPSQTIWNQFLGWCM